MNEPLIHICHASVSFGTKTVLSDVHFSVEPRDFVILRGPNGGGKTTLLRLIAGLLKPTSGNVERRRGLRLGYLPQYRTIDREFPITVGEVIRSGLLSGLGKEPSDAREAVAAVADRLHLTPYLRRTIAELSGGQWQRTLLARALVSSPELLLLDEPDTHLDAETRALLYDTLRTETARCAICIVSHDDGLHADFAHCRVVHVVDGRVEGCDCE